MKGANLMQLQAVQGYLENERFYPIGEPIRKTGRQKVIVTFLNDPVANNEPIQDEPLNAWHSRLKEAIALSMDENLPDLVRVKKMRSPINWED